MTVAALYVDPRGCYAGLEGVEVWDEARDARRYAGPHPVVAHPPCARWSRFWFGGPLRISRGLPPLRKGDDGGCFARALAAVRSYGGVLEHPAYTHAWAAHGLSRPFSTGGWSAADFAGGWTCMVDQGHYGHRAAKPTWLYAVVPGEILPSLEWSRAESGALLAGFSTHRARRDGACVVLSRRERAATPEPFRDVLLGIARSVAVVG